MSIIGGIVGGVVGLLCIVLAIVAVIIVSRRRRKGVSDSSDHDGMVSVRSSDYAVVPPIQDPGVGYTDVVLGPAKPDYVEMQVSPNPDRNYSTGIIEP